MRRQTRTPFRFLTLFLTLCVGGMPFAAFSFVTPTASANSASHCAMTGKAECNCCGVEEAAKASARLNGVSVQAKCPCSVRPAPAAPADPAPRDAVRVLAFAPPPSAMFVLPPSITLRAATPPVGGHAPPLRRVMYAPDAGRAPPSF